MKNTLAGFVATILFLASCANRKDLSNQDLPYEVTMREMGMLHYREGGTRGFLISAVKWGEPMSDENPTMHCDVKKKLKDKVICQAIEEGAKVKITVELNKVKNIENVKQITLETKGVNIFELWNEELVQNGFFLDRLSREPGTRKGVFIGPDQTTRAELVYTAAGNSLTLTLSN